ncbi:LysM peptidoglycan-binding domain-containing protein [Burkholderia sp. BCC1977]|uniref:LysM peptidoglycan-binding domain-containing protein n=1 Tax=Burkholderia sp. BCC1977 TaxID=2817440 RepID=UPI002ABE803C|nr:LysM peptidoglycan-binding domain-containing protein [Burkholderia sp. BCC1977]
MVSIVTGNGLGLQSSSALGLGNNGKLGNASFGQTGERVYVNAATGNLIIQDRDQMLLGQGVNGAVYRAYNSLGLIGGDNWRPGGTRTVTGLAGSLNAAGSSVTLTDWDGSTTVFGYEATRKTYVSTAWNGADVSFGDGAGRADVTGTVARATLAFDCASNAWQWRDGVGSLTETYDASHGGRLVSSKDRDGNTVNYVYHAAGKLSQVTTANGDVTNLEYNATGQLSALRSVYRNANGQTITSTAMRYVYDTQRRLSEVIVDLSPEDNSIADDRVFKTTYTYDGTSNRIASIAQSDGAQVSFGYRLIGGEYRVVKISERGDGGAQRVTKLAYDTANNTTTITDPLGYAKMMKYDVQGRLTSIESVAGADVQLEYLRISYENGKVLREYRTDGKTVTLLFDALGNLIKQADSSAAVSRTYGPNNEVLTEAVTDNNDPARPQRTTRYIYDAAGHLRFVVSGDGRVTEYRYNAAGQRTSEIQYTDAAYNISDLSAQNALNEAQLKSWLTGVDLRAARRADMTYDYRGKVASVTRYTKLQADGSGDLTSGISQSHYVYDPFGRVLQHIDGVTGQTRVEQFAYDGLGRLLSSTNFAGVSTLYRYDDATHAVAITFNNGLTRTSTYNAVGEAIGVADSVAGRVVSQTKSAYDANGRLRMTTDTLGRNTHYLYNSRGQIVADITPDGTLTEYVHAITTGKLTRTVTYDVRLTATQLASLVNADGSPVITVAGTNTTFSLESSKLRPAVSQGDRSTWVYWDTDSISHVIDADGFVTQTQYDGHGRPIAVTAFANRVTISGAKPVADLPTADSSNDRTTRYFYDADGRLTGELDASGYLTEYRYNGAGERVETIRYATATATALRDRGTIASLRPRDSAQDVHVNFVYDASGRLSTEIDGEGYVTRYRYDAFGNLVERVRGQQIDARQLSAPQQMTVKFKANITTAMSIEVWVDGVRGGTVPLKPGAGGDYSVPVNSTVPFANHSIEFRYGSAKNGLSITDVMLGDQKGQSASVTPSFMVGTSGTIAARFTFDIASALALASTPGHLERTAYAYDVMGRLVERTDFSDGGDVTSRYTYDDQGNLISESVRNRTLSYRYDTQGRLIGQLTGEGTAKLQALGANPTQTQIDAVWTRNGLTYRYDAAGNRAAMVDAMGNTTLYYYDHAGRLSHVVNPVGEVAAYTYDTFGDLSATTAYATRVARTLSMRKGGALTDELRQAFDALGDDGQASITSFSYSAAGRLTRRTDAEGFSAFYEYNAFGERTSVVQEISANARVRESSVFDKRGNMVVRQKYDVGGLNLLTSVVYDAFGRVVQNTDANGVVRKTQYDRSGNVVIVTDGTGAESKLTYDAFGNVLTSTDRTGATTSYAYAQFNREISVTMPEGIRTTTRYDELGQIIALTDGRGNTTSYRYDLSGNLVETIAPAGTTQQKYDAEGHLIEVTDALGILSRLSYDAAGRVLTRTVDANGLRLVTTYTYDAKGQVIRVTDPSGTVTQTSYDRNGQAISVVQDPGGLNLTTTFTFDGLGNVLTVAEGAGSATSRVTQHVYDQGGRLVSTIVDPVGLKLTTRYTYDNNGNVLSATGAAGGVTRYAYDAEGRQTWSVGPTGAVIAQEYDAEGRLTVRRAYANTISLTGLPGPASGQDLAKRVLAAAQDHIERYAYDADGRLVYTVDGLNNVVGFTYDANGNVTSTTRFAGTVAGSFSKAEIDAAVQRRSAALMAQDRISSTVYDVANRSVYTIDPIGNVTQNRYDASGNVVEKTQFAAAFSSVRGATEAALKVWVGSAANAATDRTTTYAYDAAGRLFLTIDPENYITAQRYDTAGRVTFSVRYAAPAASDARGLSTVALLQRYPTMTNRGDSAVTQYRYDKAGRLVETVDTLGTATHYDLDTMGRTVTTWRAYNNATYKMGTHTEYDAAGRAISETRAWGTPQAATTTYAYDGLGRVIATTDPNEHTTRYGYDSQGNRTSVTDALGYTTTTGYDVFGNAVKVTDAKGNNTYFYFDQLNRNVLQVNAVGSVIATEYSPSGQPTKVTHYAKACPRVIDERTLWTSIRPVSNRVSDAVTLLAYDKLDRLIESTDAEGYKEQYCYDAFGNRTGYTNKVGGTFAYAYDRRGLMLSETLPVLSNGRPVVNRFEYDARGNRVTVVEATGLPEQRVTRYEFDTLARVTKKIGESVSVYNAATKMWSSTTPTETYAYDVRGNLAQQTNAVGRTTFWYYDATDRRIAEVGPLGMLTNWSYDAAGSVVSQKIYGVAVTGTAGATPPAPNMPANVRETRYAYDAADRLIETRIVNVNTGYYDAESGAYRYDVRDIVTGAQYDALGLVIATIDGNGNRATSYYDKLGQKVLEIDAEGYAVAWSRDAMGNVVKETHFAGRPASYDAGATGDALLALWPNSPDDRITDFTYDRNGRVTSELRLKVRYASVDGHGRLTEQTGSARNRYIYDGEGHLIRRTDANGSQYGWTFDALGRQLRKQLPAFNDYLGNLVRATTDYAYDGLNNVVRETQRSSDGNTANDRATIYNYGTSGRLITKTNANGVTTDYGYDVLGNVTLATFIRSDADDVTRQEANYFRYDGAGQQIQHWSEGGPRTHTIYNVYGEVTAQGMYNNASASASNLPYFAEYDNAGRVVKSNFDRGISRAYVYDANGNATLQMESQATNLCSLTMDQILGRSDVAQTFTVYDKRNLVIDIIQPEMSGSRDVLGLKGTQIGVAGQNRVSVIVGGGLLGADTGAGRPVPPVNADSWKFVGGGTVKGFLGICVDYTNWTNAANYKGGENGRVAVDLQDADEALQALYGQYDVHVTLDYSATNISVSSLSPGKISPGSPSGHMDFYSEESYLRGDVPIQFGAATQDGSFSYTLNVYIRIKSTGEEVHISTLSERLSIPRGTAAYTRVDGRTTASLEKSNWLQLATGSLSTASTAKLYMRPAGSSSPFSELALSTFPTAGSYGLDLSFLPAGDYEFAFVATEANGTLLRRDAFGLRVPSGARIAGPATGALNAAFQATSAGTFVVNQGRIDFYELQSALGARAVQATLQYRPRGSTGGYASVQLSSLGAMGSFTWNTGGLLPNDYEVVLTVTDSGGTTQTLQGTSNPTAGRIGLSFAGVDAETTITFQTVPTSAIEIRVYYQNASGQWAYTFPKRLEPGVFVLDTTYLPMRRPGAYQVRIEAYTLQQDMVYQASGTITTGTNGVRLASLQQTGTSYNIAFDPGGFTDGNRMVLSYRPKGSADEFKQVAGMVNGQYWPWYALYRYDGDGTSMWHWDAFGVLNPGVEYEYFYEIYYDNFPRPSKLLTRVDGTFSPQDPVKSTQVLWEIRGLNNTAITIHRQQTHNAFGEVDSEIDGRGNVTRLEYNTLGVLVSRCDPEVDVTLANGFVMRMTPETRYYYDLAGNVVGTRDANGNLTTQRLNYGLLVPSVAREWQGIRANGMSDGGSRISGYDEFGNLRIFNEQVEGSTWRRTDYTYDKLSHLIRIDRPLFTSDLNTGKRATDIYRYDSAGNRIVHVNALGLSDRTYYDYDGRVVETVSAEGRNVTYRYQVTGSTWTITMCDRNGRTLVDVLDAYGRTTSHTDRGGRRFTYTYNYAGLIAKQTSTSRQNISYEYYANGLIRRMVDGGGGTDARYEYDRNGNRTFEGYTATDGRYVFQQSQVTYDVLNRVIKIVDPRYTIEYEYDAVGNRVRMFSRYNDGITGSKAIQEYWYQYDGMNRFTVTMGQLINGQRGASANDSSARVVAGNGGDGVTIAYDLAGQRRQAIYAYDGHREDYTYGADGLLTDTRINSVLRARRSNDLAGRVTSYEEWDASGKQATNLSRRWDGDNLLSEERNNLSGTGTRYEYMADGTLSATQTYGEATTSRTTYEYEWWDTAKQKNIKVQASNQSVAGWAPGFSNFSYDVNGHVKAVIDMAANRRFTYWTDGDGQVLQRDEIGNFNTARASHSYYYMGGHQVGNVGNDGVDRIDYAREMANAAATQPGDDRWKRFTPANSADFDVNYQPINSLYPGAAPGSHTVRTGETFQSLAAAYYGDATLWYILADANGMDGADRLVAGTVLTIPNKVTNIHNTYATFKPYDPGKAIGNTQPTVPAPPPPPIVYGGAGAGGGCGGMATIIAVVVAVVASVISYGALAPYAGAIGAGAAAGTAGAVSSQGVLIAAGEQSGFNWKGIALGTVSGAVAGGVTSTMSPAATGVAGAGSSNGFGSAVLQGGVRSTIAQGIGVTTGLQHSFDWKGVAVGAIASGAAYGATQAVGQWQYGDAWSGMSSAALRADSFNAAARGLGAGLAAGAASTIARGGSLVGNAGAITMDAIAGTIGNMVADNMASRATSSASSLYGPGGDVNAMTANAVRAYGGDPGQQFATQANWDLQLDAGLREQAFVDGLQDQFGQLANDALAASRAENAALTQRLGSEFAGSANWALAQQRAEHAAAARQAAATRSGLAEFDLGRGSNDWSDDAAGFDLGRGGWSNESTLSRPAQWLDRPIQPLQALADTVRRGNAMMADGLDAVGLSGLAGAQRALGDVISGAVPTRPWEIALSAAPLAVKAPGALRFAGETFGPQIDQLVVRATPGLRTYVVENGGVSGSGISASGSQFVVAPTREAVGALKNFGLDSAQRRMFFEGKQVIFEDPATIYQTATIFQLESNTLRAGIWDVVSDGSGAILSFANRSRSLATTLGVRQLELFGADLQNNALANILVRRGFTRGEPVLINSFGFNKYVPTLRRLEDLQK